MEIVKEQVKTLKLHITLVEDVRVDENGEEHENNIAGISFEGDEVIDYNYSISLTASVKGFFAINNYKEFLKEIEIHINDNAWIEKKQDDKILKHCNLVSSDISKGKGLFINSIKNIIEKYKNSFDFFRYIREDIVYNIHYETDENRKLLDYVKDIIEVKDEGVIELP